MSKEDLQKDLATKIEEKLTSKKWKCYMREKRKLEDLYEAGVEILIPGLVQIVLDKNRTVKVSFREKVYPRCAAEFTLELREIVDEIRKEAKVHEDIKIIIEASHIIKLGKLIR